MAKATRTLVVEDSRSMRKLLEHLLQERGHVVQTVPSAEEALALFDESPFDLMIVDWTLPGQNGVELTRAVRARPGGQVPFILMLTGRSGVDELVAVLDAGASDFVAKPLSSRLLETRLAIAERSIAVEQSRRRMREHLLLTDRLASVGTLAAGIAHELNNPLASVLSNLELSKEELGRPLGEEQIAQLQEQLGDALDAAERMARIVHDLHAFSSGVNAPADVVAPQEAVTAAVRLCWNELRHRVQLEQTLGPVPDVCAPQGVIAQVVLKLLLHSIASLGDEADERKLFVVTGTSPDGRALISVGHDGPLISPERMETLFDPYLTAPESTESSGLGLAISKNLVERIGGTLEAESSEVRGTHFHVSLPAAGQVRSSVPPRANDPATEQRRARVVIIDDEPMLGRSLRRVLKKHDVTVFESGRDALTHLAEADAPDLILCDLMMPEMNGIQFFEALRAEQPTLVDRVTFMTGGAFTPKTADFVRQSGRPVLAKPFDMSEIRRLVRATVASDGR